jgi:hypothetical protein
MYHRLAVEKSKKLLEEASENVNADPAWMEATRAATLDHERLVYAVLDVVGDTSRYDAEVMAGIAQKLDSMDPAVHERGVRELLAAYAESAMKLHRLDMILMYARSWREESQRQAKAEEFRE